MSNEKTGTQHHECFDDWEDPVFLVDANGVIQRVNEATFALFQCSREELIHRHVQSFLPMQEMETVQALRARYQRNPETAGVAEGVELTGVRPNGQRFTAQVAMESAPKCGENWSWVLLMEVPEGSQVNNPGTLQTQDGMNFLNG